MNNNGLPVEEKKREIFLDALRGFALLGVCLANYPEFSLYSFFPDSLAESLPSAHIDKWVKYMLYLFVDGKFYTLFTFLFGIGFSIIISNAASRGANGFGIFYRRMSVLVLIGLCHLLTIWSGDILVLYAVLGMILPLFRNVSTRNIIIVATFFLMFPVIIDGICQAGGYFLARYPYDKWWEYAGYYGITEQNFHTWLRDAGSYKEVHQFLMQGAWERMYEFIEGNRYFKVYGLFLLGFAVGREKIYANLKAHYNLIKKSAIIGCSVGLPLSIVYAYSGVTGHVWGLTVHTLLYTLSVYPLGLGYAALLGLFCMKNPDIFLWKWLSYPGRMALTNYILQSVIGMWLFYGIGLAFGASIGLGTTELIAASVFLFEVIFSRTWLLYFKYGPLEWIWRMLTYGQWLGIKR